jgi:hypothetical protein
VGRSRRVGQVAREHRLFVSKCALEYSEIRDSRHQFFRQDLLGFGRSATNRSPTKEETMTDSRMPRAQPSVLIYKRTQILSRE